MTIESTQPQTLLMTETESLTGARRLIVLIPTMDMDDSLLARRIWSIAARRRLEVLYLGLVEDTEEELRMRRRLATLAAITRDDRTSIETRVRFGRNWVKVVQQEWQSGDSVICQTEQIVSRWGRKSQPLAEMLAAALKTQVYFFSGFCHPKRPRRSQQIARFLYETMPVAIIVGFFEYQVQIAQTAKGWVQTLSVGLSVLLEFGLIWLWRTYRT